MANVVRACELIRQPDFYKVEDDFIIDQTDLMWIDTVTDSGSVTVGDGVKGIMALVPSDGTVADNDEAYVATANEVFKVAAGKPLYAQASVQFTEANTDDANVFVGFGSALSGANTLVDNGGGLRTSGDFIGLYKIDGGTKWIAITQINGTATTTTSTKTAGGSDYQKIEIEVIEDDSSYFKAVFKVDNEYLVDTNNNRIIHRVAYASATEMNFGFGVKNGAGNLETLNVDYAAAVQVR